MSSEYKWEAIEAAHRSRLDALHEERALDDRTWADLIMNDVFVAIDRTESTLGQHALYHRLRLRHSPEALTAFDALANRLGADDALRHRVQRALRRLRDPHGYDLWWLAKPGAVHAPGWYVIFPALAVLTPLAILLSLGHPVFPAVILGLLLINLVVHFTTFSRVREAAAAFRQVAPLIKTGQALAFLHGHDIDAVVEPIRQEAPKLTRLKTVARWISGDPLMLSMQPGGLAFMATDVFNVAYDYLNLIVPVAAAGVYVGAADLRRGGAGLLRLAAAIGDVDAALGVAAYRAGRPSWTRPVFTAPGTTASLAGAVHPLVNEAVPNSINLPAGAGVLVTGSNMSGKSTFLRTVGVTVVLAQTIDTCLAERYSAPWFRVQSCIGRADDLLGGKSYYLVEVEALLGLVRASESADPHLFLLDEMFRGTNAVERIAGGQAVLLELLTTPTAAKPHVTLAATHDSELVDLLAGVYAPYHFGDALTDASLTFDYQLREGRSTSRNAIALLKLNGAPQRLIDRALATAAGLEGRPTPQAGLTSMVPKY